MTESTQQPESAKTKKKRPDGSDLERYRNSERWSYRRWAWEFLRRNSEFIAACKKVASHDTEEQRQAIADRFGLKKFKPYNEAYAGQHGKPVFSIVSISSWYNCGTTQAQEKKIRSAGVSNGQALIRFDFASAVNDPNLLKEQLRLAENRLKKYLTTYAEANNLKLADEPPRHKVSLFGHYLRLLDSDAAGRRQIDSGLLIEPAKAERLQNPHFNTTRKELAPAISKKMGRANEYSTHLYRSLAVLKGRPKVKAQ